MFLKLPQIFLRRLKNPLPRICLRPLRLLLRLMKTPLNQLCCPRFRRLLFPNPQSRLLSQRFRQFR
jgi:hypothetical protein